jgi:hypothetical protein
MWNIYPRSQPIVKSWPVTRRYDMNWSMEHRSDREKLSEAMWLLCGLTDTGTRVNISLVLQPQPAQCNPPYGAWISRNPTEVKWQALSLCKYWIYILLQCNSVIVGKYTVINITLVSISLAATSLFNCYEGITPARIRGGALHLLLIMDIQDTYAMVFQAAEWLRHSRVHCPTVPEHDNPSVSAKPLWQRLLTLVIVGWCDKPVP